jgi:hypothetical protein
MPAIGSSPVRRRLGIVPCLIGIYLRLDRIATLHPAAIHTGPESTDKRDSIEAIPGTMYSRLLMAFLCFGVLIHVTASESGAQQEVL